MVWLSKTTVSWKCQALLYGHKQPYCSCETDIYKDIAEDIEKGFDALHYERDTLLPKGKNEKVIVLMKDE